MDQISLIYRRITDQPNALQVLKDGSAWATVYTGGEATKNRHFDIRLFTCPRDLADALKRTRAGYTRCGRPESMTLGELYGLTTIPKEAKTP